MLLKFGNYRTAILFGKVDHIGWGDYTCHRWFVDFAAYNWKLIYTHLHTSYKSGHLQEAERTYQQLLTHTHGHFDELADTDFHLIQGLEKIFRACRSDTNMATAYTSHRVESAL